MRIERDNPAAAQYFAAFRAALAGLDAFLASRNSPLHGHDLIGQVVTPYLERLRATFECWENRIGFSGRFRIARAESGFPVFQNLLALENDKRGAGGRLADMPSADELRAEMADFILRNRAFPAALQQQMAERRYLERLDKSEVFSPIVLPETVRVSVNPKTGRPFYVVHWGAFDGSQSLPMVYMATIEDSSQAMADALVSDGRLNEEVAIPLPVGGLLNPDLAHRFDDFVEKNSAYTLSPSTIATNLDHDFDALHPKQLRRFVLGPFYGAGLTEHGDRVSAVLERVRLKDGAWLLTWTVQEVFSTAEKPARRGLWSRQPARETFHVDTHDLEAVQQGVSAYEKHALVPHGAYQALYADGEAGRIFDGYRVHVISGSGVITEV